jgi:hypothetical protein
VSRFSRLRALNARTTRQRTAWQGPLGVLCVVVATGLLASVPWAVLTAGGFLLLGELTAGR